MKQCSFCGMLDGGRVAASASGGMCERCISSGIELLQGQSSVEAPLKVVATGTCSFCGRQAPQVSSFVQGQSDHCICANCLTGEVAALIGKSSSPNIVILQGSVESWASGCVGDAEQAVKRLESMSSKVTNFASVGLLSEGRRLLALSKQLLEMAQNLNQASIPNSSRVDVVRNKLFSACGEVTKTIRAFEGVVRLSEPAGLQKSLEPDDR